MNQSKTRWNNVVLLTITQSLIQTCSVLMSTLSAVVGLELATNKNLATLPIAVISLGTAAMLIPASLLIRKFGQRNGFMAGAVIGVLAGLAMWRGIIEHSFQIFVFGNMLVGFYSAFAQYYRFAAADSVPDESKGKAISFVMTGGVVAAVAGPTIAKYTQHLGDTHFVFSYVSVTALSLLAFLVMFGLRLERSVDETVRAKQDVRSIWRIVSQKVIVTALISSVVGYSVMVIVMTATPLAMHGFGHSHNDSATVIQWHVLGMFVPSFFTGALIDRFGARNVILIGILFLCAHIAFALTGTDFMHFVSGLILLGIGWNFMFIGGTTILTKSYRPAEKEKTQAFHDFTVFAVISLSSFSAGGLLNTSGWFAVNVAAIPLLLIALVTILIAKRNHKLAVAVDSTGTSTQGG